MKICQFWQTFCIIVILVWISILLVSIKKQQVDILVNNLNKNLTNVLFELKNLYKNNAELKHQVIVLNQRLRILEKNNSKQKQLNGPSEEYELLRRHIYSNTKEFWYYISSELRSLAITIKDIIPITNRMVKTIYEHYRSLLNDIVNLANVDGHSQWRQKEYIYLNTLVEKRLRFLQNPQDCSKSKKLVCNLISDRRSCGYSCRLHHLVNCLVTAYATKRTLILDNPHNWGFTSGGLSSLFFPLSNTCTSSSDSNETVLPWPGNESVQVVNLSLPIAMSGGLNRVQGPLPPPFNPLVLPEDLYHRINVLHGDPAVWWIGQFVNFIIREQISTTDIFEEYEYLTDFTQPAVGFVKKTSDASNITVYTLYVSISPNFNDFTDIHITSPNISIVHIRRTDKIGSFHKLEEYMYHVEEYYKLKELTGKVFFRKIYLATDDPTLFDEAFNKYPEYQIYGDPELSKTGSVATRELDKSIININIDVYFLSHCDYLVCTFSSNVCRLAYEIMNGLNPEDASTWFTSLDDIYYYSDQIRRLNVAILPHKANGQQEMDLQVGDEIEVIGNEWNGYSKGIHLRTNKTLLYPTFKVIQKIEVMSFASYSSVEISAEELDE